MHPVLGFPVLAVTIPDAITFAASALIVLAGAIGVVASRNPVHSALFLIMTLFGIAVLFVEQEAQFLAVVQVIVYAGAIVVLFLFVIMLVGVDQEERMAADPLRAQRPTAVLLGVMTLAEVLLLARVSWPTGVPAVAGSTTAPGSNVEQLARSVFTTYLIPFEATSVLLIIAVVAAVVLARRPRPDRPEQQEVTAGGGVGAPAAAQEAGVGAPAAAQEAGVGAPAGTEATAGGGVGAPAAAEEAGVGAPAGTEAE